MPITRPNANTAGFKRRRIVQIAVTYDSHPDMREDRLYALCDDSSVWVMVWDGRDDGDHSRWGRLVDIPQD